MNNRNRVQLIIYCWLIAILLSPSDIRSINREVKYLLPNNEWEDTFPFEQNVVRMIAHPQDPQIIYAATSGGSTGQKGVYRSNNGGDNWEHIGGEWSVTDLYIDLCDSQTIYLTEGRNVRWSTNAGDDWNGLKEFGATDYTVAVAACDGNVVVGVKRAFLFVGYDVIYRYDPNLGQWAESFKESGAFGGIGLDFTQMAFDLNDDTHQRIYASHGGKGVLISNNGGGEWIPKNDGQVLCLDIGRKVRNVNFYGGAVWITLNCSGEHRIYKSIDRGDSWIPLETQFANTDVSGVAFDSFGMMYVGTHSDGGQAQGVYRCATTGAGCNTMNSGWSTSCPDLNHLIARTTAAAGTITNTLYAGSNKGVYRYTQTPWTPSAWIYLPLVTRFP